MTVTDGDGNEVALHPLNEGFVWDDRRGPFRYLTKSQVDEFDQRGFFVLPDVFDAEALEPIIEELDEFESHVDDFLVEMADERFAIAERGAITFAPNLVTHSPTLEAFARSEVFTMLCHDLIGPDANLYWDQAVYKKSQKPRRFPWHQDNGYTFVRPQQYLTCWVALTDATIDNGCPHVAPGLHRHGTLRHSYVEPLGWQIFEDPPEEVCAPVPRGGIVVFSSLTPHLTGPNVTDAVRKAYILQYAPEGAVRIDGIPGGETTEVQANDPNFQFPVLRGGEPV
jgi:phytanoyl-CoA hydroxylase